MNRKTWIGLALWALTLAIAYFAGHALAPVATIPTHEPTVVGQDRPSESSRDLATDGAITSAATLAQEEAESAALRQAAALQALLNGDRSPETWLKAMAEAMDFSPAQLRETIDALQGLPPGFQRDRMILDLLARWGQLDPANALFYAGDIESARLRSRAMGEVLKGWASQDPVSAIGWLTQHGGDYPARVYGDYLSEIAAGYARANPQAAFDYVQALPEETLANRRAKDEALRRVIDTMVEQGQLDTALDWTLTLEDSSGRTSALTRLMDQWARQDPAAAQAFLATMADDPAYGQLQESLLRSWADNDPTAAAEWISALDPEDPNMPSLATSLIFRWTDYDLAGAAEWLNTLPASPELDRAVGVMAMRSAQDDPEAAWTWAQSMSDNGWKDRLTFRIAGMLNEQNPEALEAFLAESDYSDDKKQQYREATAPEGGGRGWGRGRPPR